MPTNEEYIQAARLKKCQKVVELFRQHGFTVDQVLRMNVYDWATVEASAGTKQLSATSKLLVISIMEQEERSKKTESEESPF
jgi:precorrin-6B methylase 2